MKTVSIRFSDMDKKTLLYLGYVGENLHRRILIDCKREFEEMPGAIPALVVTAPNGLKYPVDVTVEGNTVIWDITNSDLIHEGNGEIQLALTKDEEVGKSAVCRTKVDKSIEPDGEAPDPIENWLIRAENLLEEIPEEIADAIEEAKASGMFDGVGISSIGYVRTVGQVNIYRINLTDGSFYDFEVSNGEDGQPGTNGVGIANIAKTGTVGLVDTYTITLTNGQTYPFTVTNGQNGAEIDDTTPALNKVFSSSKVDDELTRVKSDLQVMKPAATNSDIGKALIVKTVADGVPTSYEYGETGGDDPAVIEQKVNAWLNQNITNPDSPPLDRSLTSSSAAAPADMVGDINSAVTLFTGNTKYTGWTTNKWIKYTAPQTMANETGWECILVQCNPGDVFNVKGYSGASPRLWCFSDSQGNALTYAAISTITSEYIEIVAPANAAYLACNSKYSEIKGGLIKGKIIKKQVDNLEEAYEKSGFNQIMVGGNFESATGWIGNGSPSWTLAVSDNVLTATVNSRIMKLQRQDDYPNIKAGHKYYASVEYYGSDFETVDVLIGNSATYGDTTASTWNRISTVLKAASVAGAATDCQLEVKLTSNYTASSMKIKNFWVVDLTEMYGEGNEPTAAEFVQMYGNSYYPYLNVPHDPKVTDFVVKKQVTPLNKSVYESITPDGYEPGYLSSDGTISSQGGTTLEVTSTPIFDICSASISITFTESKSQWCAFCAYNSKGQKVGDRQTLSVTGTVLSGEFTFPEDAAFIRFSFRTYGGGYTLNLKGIHSSAKASKRLNVVSDRTMNVLAKMGKPCYHHLFVQNSGSNITIPHQSPFDVRVAKRFGFNMIEGNVQTTSDGHYFVNHLASGSKFGGYFTHVDGTTDVSDIVASTVTWDWMTQNLRYKSSIPKYRTAPCSLEEFLSECKQNDLIPFITITDATIKSIADKYMGKDNYVAYTGSRLYCPNTTCYAWRSEASKDAIVKFCLKMGKPLIYGMANPGSFTDSELREIVDALHELGFMIGTAYQDTNWHKYSAIGFDFVAGMGIVNRMESGNLYNFNSIFNFNDFTVTGATETDGVLVFSSAGSIVPNANDLTYQLAMIDVGIVFNGEITLTAIGEQYNNMTFTSDGSKPIFMAIPIVNGGIKPTINVSSGTTVYEVTYLASVV